LRRCNEYKDLSGFENLAGLRQRKWQRTVFFGKLGIVESVAVFRHIPHGLWAVAQARDQRSNSGISV